MGGKMPDRTAFANRKSRAGLRALRACGVDESSLLPRMAIPQKKPHIPPEEYLRLERAAEYKSEYFAGEIFAMAGGKAAHSLISANVIRESGNHLRGKGCVPYDCNLRIMVPATGLYTYPDVSVICGPLEYAPATDGLSPARPTRPLGRRTHRPTEPKPRNANAARSAVKATGAVADPAGRGARRPSDDAASLGVAPVAVCTGAGVARPRAHALRHRLPVLPRRPAVLSGASDVSGQSTARSCVWMRYITSAMSLTYPTYFIMLMA